MTEAMAPASTMPRPSLHDKAIVREAAEKLAADCAKWDDSDSSPEAWVDDLAKLSHEWGDGYELAKALDDRCGVSPDSELVEILDSASSYLWAAHRDAVRKWAQIVGFTPQFAVGDTVETPRHGPGVVRRVEMDEARYVVATFERQWTGPGSGWVLDAEQVRAAQGGVTEGRDGEAGSVSEANSTRSGEA
jgi:hypothetical protein